jgi:LuxR family maltose regulon positive regulatory protein
MNVPLLSTKTFLPPVPDYQVLRPRLEQRLDEALHRHHKLILVSAPPGSGKSSLVAAWIAHRAVPPAWVFLEEGDNDPVRFWSYILASIQAYFQDQIPSLLEALNSAPSLPEATLPALINLLNSRSKPLVIVLDDYHSIANKHIQQGILYLVDHLPAQVCLAITTRIDPPLPIHLWRARGQLTEIRAADLRFTLEEASEFLTRQMGLDLQPPDVQKLEQRTEGWATGLQLAALSMQGRSDLQAFVEHFSGSHYFVLEYLMNEVLARQTPVMQDFLLCTSILESFCASLCERVLGSSRGEESSDAADLLASVERSNLFLTPLDEEHQWFRYHHLFAEFLSQRLKKLGEGKARPLHQRAAEWYNDHARVDEALQHALLAGDLPFAVQILRRHAMQAASDGRSRAVVRWLEMLPAPLLAEDLQLSLLYTWMLLASGKTDAIEPPIRNIRRQLAMGKADQLAPADRNALLGQLAALEAMQAAREGNLAASEQFIEEARRYATAETGGILGLAWLAQANLQRELGNFEPAITAYQQALTLVPASGILSGTWIMVQYLGQSYLVQGQLQAAEDLYRSRLHQAEEQGLTGAPAFGLLEINLAGIEYEKNHLVEARALYKAGLANSKRSGLVELQTSAALLGVKLSRLGGELPQAIFDLQETLQTLRSAGSPGLSAEIGAWLARWNAETGNLEEAARAWSITPGTPTGWNFFACCMCSSNRASWKKPCTWRLNWRPRLRASAAWPG